MEDTLRESELNFNGGLNSVLILVLMEDTLRAIQIYPSHEKISCLNPCFNGRYSQRRNDARSI